jgi:predicted DNA binding CopG/RHH family protein
MEKSMTQQQLPKTDSIQELAQFWDSHDLTDFEDELEEVTDRVFESDADITVHLESSDARAVREHAKMRGVQESELIREWVHERISSGSGP